MRRWPGPGGSSSRWGGSPPGMLTATWQTMSMPHDRMLRTYKTYTWTDKYIFPGGLLPSIPAFEHTLAGHTRLHIADRFSFGAHYAATLGLWRARVYHNWPLVGGTRVARGVPPTTDLFPRVPRR